MATRTAQPPELAGYSYERLIGQGGFADVFLYQELRPSRPVAIKVLLDSDLDGPGRLRFDAEANVMAQLATHPSIVPIYKADVALDGRPYLVMEFCPRPNLALRSRLERLAVPEALEIAIRISGAVETAHRAGILHRDIKPHNVLTNAYGHPKLTDFGIAVVTGEQPDTEIGLSIPWSPPEMFHGRPPEDVRGDVWSLGATLYTLLAGHSPYEVVGGTNSSQVLIDRIQTQPLPRLNRPDLPEKLEPVLAKAMSKKPEDRYASANAFARALQDVQIDMHLAPTRIDVLDASDERPHDVDDDGRTRVSPVMVISPQAPHTTGPRSYTGMTGSAPVQLPDHAGRFVAAPVVPADEETLLRPGGITPSAASHTGSHTGSRATTGPRRALPWVLAVVAAVVIAVVVGLVVTAGDDPTPAPTPSLDAPEDPNGPNGVVVDGVVPAVTGLAGVRTGDQVTFTWTNPDPRPGDFYLWTQEGETPGGQAPTADAAAQRTTDPTVTFTAAAGTTACIRVLLARENGGITSSSTAPLVCAVDAP